MRTLIALAIALLVTVVPVMAQSAADEAGVRNATKQWMTANNKHDAKAVGALLDEDVQNWTGERKSRADAVKYLEDRFKRMKDVQVTIAEDIGVDFITPDIAIHKFYSKASGFVDADGKPIPPGKGLYGFLYVKKNGQWLRRANFWRREQE
jgi:ketosteroid isomerase-like protein